MLRRMMPLEPQRSTCNMLLYRCRILHIDLPRRYCSNSSYGAQYHRHLRGVHPWIRNFEVILSQWHFKCSYTLKNGTGYCVGHESRVKHTREDWHFVYDCFTRGYCSWCTLKLGRNLQLTIGKRIVMNWILFHTVQTGHLKWARNWQRSDWWKAPPDRRMPRWTWFLTRRCPRARIHWMCTTKLTSKSPFPGYHMQTKRNRLTKRRLDPAAPLDSIHHRHTQLQGDQDDSLDSIHHRHTQPQDDQDDWQSFAICLPCNSPQRRQSRRRESLVAGQKKCRPPQNHFGLAAAKNKSDQSAHKIFLLSRDLTNRVTWFNWSTRACLSECSSPDDYQMSSSLVTSIKSLTDVSVFRADGTQSPTPSVGPSIPRRPWCESTDRRLHDCLEFSRRSTRK